LSLEMSVVAVINCSVSSWGPLLAPRMMDSRKRDGSPTVYGLIEHEFCISGSRNFVLLLHAELNRKALCPNGVLNK